MYNQQFMIYVEKYTAAFSTNGDGWKKTFGTGTYFAYIFYLCDDEKIFKICNISPFRLRFLRRQHCSTTGRQEDHPHGARAEDSEIHGGGE